MVVLCFFFPFVYLQCFLNVVALFVGVLPLVFCRFTPSPPGYQVEMRQKAPPPAADGLSGYIVEKKGRRGGEWTKANAFPVEGTEYTCINLPEGAVYEFRVVAVNDAGPGKPSKPTEAHTVRDPVCKSKLYVNV